MNTLMKSAIPLIVAPLLALAVIAPSAIAAEADYYKTPPLFSQAPDPTNTHP